MNRLSHIIGVILDPRFWYEGRPVSHEWSDRLDQLMDEGHKVERVTTRSAGLYYKLGPVTVSCDDYYPGTWGAPVEPWVYVRARRRTAIRLKGLVDEYRAAIVRADLEAAIRGEPS